MKKLKDFLKKHQACSDGLDFAKDLTLKQFLDLCERGDWILWLFKRTNNICREYLPLKIWDQTKL